MSPTEIKVLTQKVNADLNSINLARHTGMPMSEIASVLTKHGLDTKPVRDHIHADEGRLHVEVKKDIWISMTWYRLESGRYEIVIYATSNHDDHRDPYTTVMDSSSKGKAKKTLTNLLDPINKNYAKGKAEAFSKIQDAIAQTGLDWHEFEDETQAGRVKGDQGRKNIPIGNGLYLSVSWYKMPSGKYEIVSYVS